MFGEVLGNDRQDCQEIGFERMNGACGCIVLMNIEQYKLVVYLPNVFHGPLVLFTGFIVQDLEIN